MRIGLVVLGIVLSFLRSDAYAELRPYWVFFTDRGSMDVGRVVAAKTASPAEPKYNCRRALIFGREAIFDEKDIAVYPEYIARISEIAGGVRTVTRFLNGVSVDLDEAGLQQVKGLPFVRDVAPVRFFKRRPVSEPEAREKPAARERREGFRYGDSYEQQAIIGVPRIHTAGYGGEGITIAVLDSGFDRLEHTAFDSLTIAAAHDFVDGDDIVSGDDHGTEVLSIMAALDDGLMIGTAPYATYLLARTEKVEGNVEEKIEEDYWVAGIEWADSLGADIVNSSLGYTTFDNGTGYTYGDLDGDTAVTTIAADAAAAKGIIVVTSAGNEGDTDWYYVTTPADGDSVIAIGAIDANDIVTDFSSRGPTFDGRTKPDFMALGDYVLVADATRANAYKYVSGTSYAAPAVSGAVALLLDINPSWDYGTVHSRLVLTARAADPDSLYGYGIVDAFEASGLDIPEPGISLFEVYDPYPQPARLGKTTHRIYFPMYVPEEKKKLAIRIFTFNGETVQSLEAQVVGSGLLRDPGEAPSWDGTNYLGEDVAPGVYYYSIRLFGYGTHTGKIMVMR